MLKSVVLCLLLWHEMCQFSSHAHPGSNYTRVLNFPTFVSSKINDTDVQIEPNVNYIFNITPIFYLNGPLFGTSDFGSNLTSTDNVSMTKLSRDESDRHSQSALPQAKLTQSEPTAPTTCPGQNRQKEGYIVMDGIGAHKLHTEELTWRQAEQVCIDEGGHLAVPRSKLEHQVIRNMIERELMPKGPYDLSFISVWMGYRYECESSDWITVFGESLKESGWLDGSDWHHERAMWDCAVSFLKFEEDDFSDYNLVEVGMTHSNCNTTQPFVCKITST